MVEELLNAKRKTIKNEKIDMYNYAAEVSLSKSRYVNIMKATTMMAAGKPEETKDGLHYSRFILKAVSWYPVGSVVLCILTTLSAGFSRILACFL